MSRIRMDQTLPCCTTNESPSPGSEPFHPPLVRSASRPYTSLSMQRFPLAIRLERLSGVLEFAIRSDLIDTSRPAFDNANPISAYSPPTIIKIICSFDKACCHYLQGSMPARDADPTCRYTRGSLQDSDGQARKFYMCEQANFASDSFARFKWTANIRTSRTTPCVSVTALPTSPRLFPLSSAIFIAQCVMHSLGYPASSYTMNIFA